MVCRVCETEVPAAAFCGTCGAQLSAQHGDGRGRLRIGAYAAAPGEHTLRLSVASSLFPHLPHRSRTPFRVALVLLFLALITFALLRWQAPLVMVGALGIPMLFLLYLHESDVDDDLPRTSLALTAAIGIALGVGWALVTGAIIADANDVALGDAGTDAQAAFDTLTSLAIPVGAAVLTLVPAVVMRLSATGYAGSRWTAS